MRLEPRGPTVYWLKYSKTAKPCLWSDFCLIPFFCLWLHCWTRPHFWSSICYWFDLWMKQRKKQGRREGIPWLKRLQLILIDRERKNRYLFARQGTNKPVLKKKKQRDRLRQSIKVHGNGLQTGFKTVCLRQPFPLVFSISILVFRGTSHRLSLNLLFHQ